jgi:hypothetical protein
MTPATSQRRTVLGLGLDGQTCADKPAFFQAAVQLISKRLAHECSGQQLVSGWVELCGRSPVGWWQTSLNRALLQASRQAMSQQAFGTEPAQNRLGRKRSKSSQRLQAQPSEQVGEVSESIIARQPGRATRPRESKHTDRERREKLGRPTFWHYQGRAGRRLLRSQASGKKPIGYTNSAATGPNAPGTSNSGNYSLDRGGHLGCQRLVAPKITRRSPSTKSKLAGLEHFGSRGERLDSCHCWLPPTSLCRDVSREDFQTRTAPLCLPPAHTRPDACYPGRRRRGYNLVG